MPGITKARGPRKMKVGDGNAASFQRIMGQSPAHLQRFSASSDQLERLRGVGMQPPGHRFYVSMRDPKGRRIH